MKLFRIPRLLRWFYPNSHWGILVNTPEVFLTFDDGPDPELTPWILDLLKQNNCKATFFCVGANAQKYPDIVQRIIAEGHTLGNHTMYHDKGWRISTKQYLDSVQEASQFIPSSLFRPPYGKLTWRQSRQLRKAGYRIIMWSWLSYDFDQNVDAETIIQRSASIEPGDIIVFHDNPKCGSKLKTVLPEIIQQLTQDGLEIKSIPTGSKWLLSQMNKTTSI